MDLFVAILCGVWATATFVTLLCIIGYIANGDLQGRTTMQLIFKLTPKAWWETTVFNPVGGIFIWVGYVFINPIALILLAISYLMKD